MKICTSCHIEKSLFEFSPSKRGGMGVQAKCKPCYAKIMRERRLANPQAHRDSIKKSTQKHYQAKLKRNAEYRAKNPKKVFLWKQQDRLKHRPRVLADTAYRRASKLQRTPAWANKKAIQAFYETAQGLSMITGEWHHVDHIIPLLSKTVCGLHIETNLQVITAKENLRKGAKLNAEQL